MLTHFPIVQPDELLGSLLTRFIKQHGLINDKVALDMLFGNRKVVPSALLQGHIKELLEHIGHIWLASPEQVIKSHTLLPIFKPFIPRQRYQEIMNNLIVGTTNSSSLRTGMNAGLLMWPSTYQVCPLCLKKQRDTLGFYYARRLFQCAGVEACPKHHCLLVSTPIAIQSEHRHQFTGLPWQLDISLIAQIAEPKLCQLACLIEDLFNYSSDTLSYLQWSCYFRHLALSQQLMKGNRIDHEKISSAVRDYWGDQWLTKQGLELKKQNSWLLAMFRKHRRSFSYLQYFVVCLALDKNKSTLDRFLHQVANTPNATEPEPSLVIPVKQADMTNYQNEWLQLMRSNPDASLKILRSYREGARLYTWLYRHCLVWLEGNKPAAVKNYVNNRVNWHQRDLSFVKQLLKLEWSLICQLKGPRRSKNWYSKQINQLNRMLNKLNLLPLCSLFFDRYSESVEEYQTRRLACVMDHLLDKKDYLRPVCEIERDAGLSRQRSRQPAREILRLDIPAWQRSSLVSSECPVDRNRQNQE
ncbi:TnsD family transposase [Shewanella sp. Isolate13]|uniref:TnsD family Tn7-like transposition protein n=1 Tax=Shewanella sp. Isolate13 TaxID=2908531 RepID=UPI001EFDA945|nr:TnsD family Tn7-like transposition protein [Shewanella sp. Isolate13]MCG9731114.1 TnsD family transposase [Shewanella sp. Isolate13]